MAYDWKAMPKWFVRFIKTLAESLEEESPARITDDLDEIKNNHLVHIQASLEHLISRVGQLEARVAILFGLLSIGVTELTFVLLKHYVG